MAVCAVAGVCAIPTGATPAAAGPFQGPARSLSVAVGFDGAIRPGAPTPVDVQTPPMPAAGAAQVIIDAAALAPQTGRATVSTVVPFQAVAGIAVRLRVPVVVQDVRRPLRVRVVLDGRPVASAEVRFDPARVAGRLVVLVSDARAGLGILREIDERAVDAYVPAGALPARWQEYAGVDLVVLRDVDPARMSDAQRAALLTYVRLGGRLVVIARAGGRALPAFLMPVLPAYLGPPAVVSDLHDLAAKYGGPAPPGPVPVVALAPRPAAQIARAGGAPVIAAAAAGDGYVTVWGIDPTAGPLAEWPGRQRVWAEALGVPAPPLVEPAALAERLSPRIPVDRFSHLFAGLLIALYIGGVALVRRRVPTMAGAAVGIVSAVLALTAFAQLAVSARARSAALTQVAVLRQARDAPVARALVVAAAAVPYGGPVAVRSPADSVAAPLNMIGDLRVEWHDDAAALSGVVRPHLPWLFQALAAVPSRASARFDAGTETLTAEVGEAGLSGADLWWRGFVYPVGDLPAGRTTHRIGPAGWRRAAELAADDSSTAQFFRAPGSRAPGAIMQLDSAVLVGRWAGRAPGFVLMPQARNGRTEESILVIPVDGPPPPAPRAQP